MPWYDRHYSLPNFINPVNVWRNNLDPMVDDPTFSFNGQLRMMKSAFFGLGVGGFEGSQLLFAPKGTILYAQYSTSGADFIECPVAGFSDGKFLWNVLAVGVQALGFDNQCVVALLRPVTGNWPSEAMP